MFALVLDNLLVPLRSHLPQNLNSFGGGDWGILQDKRVPEISYSGVMMLNDILDLNRIYSHVFDLILHLDAASRAVA